MSSPEKLIKSAKAGNLREVRKMLGRNVQITKDKVGCKGSYRILYAYWNKFVRQIYVYLAHNHVQEKTCYMSTKILPLLVWEYCTPWSCVEWPQWYRQSTSPCILLCGQHQQLWVHSPALGQSKWPRQSCENSAQMASRSVTAESGVQIRVDVLIHHIEGYCIISSSAWWNCSSLGCQVQPFYSYICVGLFQSQYGCSGNGKVCNTVYVESWPQKWT